MSKLKDPAAIAARKARRLATAQMTKCPCGNVAGLGEIICGRCRDQQEKLEHCTCSASCPVHGVHHDHGHRS